LGLQIERKVEGRKRQQAVDGVEQFSFQSSFFYVFFLRVSNLEVDSQVIVIDFGLVILIRDLNFTLDLLEFNSKFVQVDSRFFSFCFGCLGFTILLWLCSSLILLCSGQ